MDIATSQWQQKLFTLEIFSFQTRQSLIILCNTGIGCFIAKLHHQYNLTEIPVQLFQILQVWEADLHKSESEINQKQKCPALKTIFLTFCLSNRPGLKTSVVPDLKFPDYKMSLLLFGQRRSWSYKLSLQPFFRSISISGIYPGWSHHRPLLGSTLYKYIGVYIHIYVRRTHIFLFDLNKLIFMLVFKSICWINFIVGFESEV